MVAGLGPALTAVLGATTVIVTNEADLRVPCRDVSSKAEGDRVGRLLVDVLLKQNKKATVKAKKTATAILKGRVEAPEVLRGLSAVQIGVPVRACVVMVSGSPFVLINPKITCHSAHSAYWSGHPKGPGRMSRWWEWVVVECDNLGNETLFGNPDRWASTPKDIDAAVLAQVQIGLCYGLLHGDVSGDQEVPEFELWGPPKQEARP